MWVLILHSILCAIYFLLKKKGRVSEKKNEIEFPAVIVFVLPIFGFLMWLVELVFVEKKDIKAKEVELEKLKVIDAKYRRLIADESTATEAMMPLEDALLVNDSQLRRSLLLDILHKNPEEYLQTLSRAKESDDVEITHYATTTLLEIQGEYEQKLQHFAREFSKKENDPDFLKEYIHCLHNYIQSGLIDGNVLQMQQQKLLQVLEGYIKIDDSSREYKFLYVESALDKKEYDVAEKVLDAMKEDAKETEIWNQLAVRLYWETHRTEDIRNVLNSIKNSDMHLTREGKEWFRFWCEGNNI